MIVRFENLNVGDRFYLFGSEYIKIDDRKYGGQLSTRPANAINMSNNHRVVVGNKTLVKSNLEAVDIEYLYI